MELNERKIKILQAIILNYLESAEPVGSRTISKHYDLGISSATVRNEMSDLEELGLIIQPYTSAGRIPSDEGYRLYVDNLLKAKMFPEKVEMEFILEKVDRIEGLLQDIAKTLAVQTNYTTIVTTPQYKKTKLKHIQLVLIDERNILTVIVVEGNLIKNHLLIVNYPVEEETLAKINGLLNKNLQGLNIQQINLEIILQLKSQVGVYSDIINGVLEAIVKTVKSVDEVDLYTSGANNLLKCPEFNNIEKAAEILYTLEEKGLLLAMIQDVTQNFNKEIKILIGNENSLKSLEDCSFITTTYNLGDDNIGTIGIIGPKRMDYVNAVSMLNYTIRKVNRILNESSSNE
ncbi:heat-inducible transcription repressor HrcA [Natranaerovirga hydrolytica]|uniref:Heat-inducible transcription repressor HrcA n=1 Tax=Natranaerovirga hydrolytica TaxID=680378 RepID=A0A4R1N0K7_9FIRM|nr:heat-inducible transcriptional repressor HrcA [Natranaerovirga hydrolytica]TCK98402.1 heat-inducible transcription repressor HrcA [Natranaerovirga hydrolytica]